MFIALATFSMANLLHDANDKSSSKSNELVANEAKNLKTQVKGEINKQMKKRQI